MEDRPPEPLLDGESVYRSSPPGSRAVSEIAIVAGKVAAIVEAAERAAEELRLQTEERVRARIAEADRAANLRVEAAEDEARELLAAARREAAVVHAEAASSAAQTLEDARQRTAAELRAAQDEAARARAEAEAEAEAEQTLATAKAQARELVTEARRAAQVVLSDGTALSENLGQLSVSLRRNAERLLGDVQGAHARLIAELDEPGAAPRPAGRARTSAPRRDRPSEDLDVPEFLPGRR